MGVGLEYLFGPIRRLNNTAHNEPDLRAINLPDLSSSDQSIKLAPMLEGILLGLNRSAMIGEIPLAPPFRLIGP
jgi:hypothetical protein